MDYDYLEVSIPFHHLLQQVYLKISMMSDDIFLLMHKLFVMRSFVFYPNQL